MKCNHLIRVTNTHQIFCERNAKVIIGDYVYCKKHAKQYAPKKRKK